MKKKIKFAVLTIIIIVLGAVYSYGDWMESIYIQTATSGDNHLSNELTGDTEIRQTFTCPYDGLNGLEIKLLRVGEEKINGYTWRLLDENQSEVAAGKIGEEELSQKRFLRKKIVEINLLKQEESKGKEYTFVLTGKNVQKTGCLQAYTAEKNKHAEALSVDEKGMEEALVLKMSIHRFNVETFVVFLGLALYVGVFLKFMYKLFR